MADNGIGGNGDEPSRAPYIFYLNDFFEKVEKIFSISLDKKMRVELDRAYHNVVVSVHRRRATTTRAAEALDDLSAKTKAFLTAFNRLECQFPGLLNDVKDHVLDDQPDQIMPLIFSQKQVLMDEEIWSTVIACILILAMGSQKKSDNIRKWITKGKPGPRRHFAVDALIRKAIRIYGGTGRRPAIGGSLEGPFPRFLTELYGSFPGDLQRDIAPSAKAFVSRARDIANGG